MMLVGLAPISTEAAIAFGSGLVVFPDGETNTCGAACRSSIWMTIVIRVRRRDDLPQPAAYPQGIGHSAAMCASFAKRIR